MSPSYRAGGRLCRLPGPVLFAHTLGSEQGYEQTHRVCAGDTAILHGPFDITLAPVDLLP
ncbi:hypothetical protein ACFWPH_16075 [Nocardia sp. NPDC058499]|uniref:hypothetical protein n=1 Tax=Nocardia sp. NPDC058499 TaxID=3346530 RepID=UPI003655A953